MANFHPALWRTLLLEGGHANDPADMGGATWYGVSRVSHPTLEPWPPTLDMVAKIYQDQYWHALDLDHCGSQAVAERLMDLAVQRGPFKAATMLQEALNLLEPDTLMVDGLLGSITKQALADACARGDAHHLARTLQALQVEHYLNRVREAPSQRRFIRGWLRRGLE